MSLDTLVRTEYHIPPSTVEVMIREVCVVCGNFIPEDEDHYDDEYGTHCAKCLSVLGDFS